MSKIRHVVVFTWNEGITDDDIARVGDALTALPAAIPEIRDYRFGSDIGVNDGNSHYAVVADFDHVDGYLVYRDHPAHRQVITEVLSPLMAGRAATQFAIS
jgi:hypothetical protein